MLYLPFPRCTEPCSYLPGLSACFEQAQIWGYDDEAFCRLVELAFRRFGPLFFRYACPGHEAPDPSAGDVPDAVPDGALAAATTPAAPWCGRCVPLRVPVAAFRASRTQRRVARGGAAIRMELGVPEPTPEKHALYLRFQTRFADAPLPPDPLDYESFCGLPWFIPTPYAYECRYWLGEQLVGVGLIDLASRVLSSTYFYHDPAHAAYSLGMLSMQRELELAAARGIPYYYHGYVVAANRHMRYKLDLRPLEFFDGESWRPLRLADGTWLHDPDALRTGHSRELLVASDEPLTDGPAEDEIGAK